jgi:hypothetical protein
VAEKCNNVDDTSKDNQNRLLAFLCKNEFENVCFEGGLEKMNTLLQASRKTKKRGYFRF